MKRRAVDFLICFFAVAMVIIGTLIFCYPLISASVSNNAAETAVENFENLKASLQSADEARPTEDDDSQSADSQSLQGTTLEKLRAEMLAYNEKIYENGQQGLCDAWSYEQSSISLSEYGLSGCAVGVLKIPAMNNLEMPLYLGASKANMSSGAAQLGQTSMPIGGKNTNCVIAGHRGWNGARYFLDIEQLVEGDFVYIENLWETLTYKVSEIKIIDPDDIDAVKIRDGEDMVTLITCHPYWASTYRYAVFCTRFYGSQSVEASAAADSAADADLTAAESAESIADGSSQGRIAAERASYFCVPAFLILLVAALIVRKKRRK